MACLLGGLVALSAWAEEPVSFGWQPGFPMRAGPQVLLLWNPHPGAERYAVTRKDLSTGQLSRWEVPSVQFIDTAVPESSSCSYTIQALLPGGAPGPISEERKLLVVAPLAPPRWIGTFQQGSAVSLAWERVEGAAFYNVYRGEGDGPASLVASVQDTKHLDAAARAGVTYSYRLRAVGVDSRESKDSEVRRLAVTAAGVGVQELKAQTRFVSVARRIQTDEQHYRLKEPTDLALTRDALFVTDLGSRSVLVLATDGTFLQQFGRQPADYVGPWGIPWGIGASAGGDRLALTFLRAPRVRVFTREGRMISDLAVERPRALEDRPEVPQPMDVAVDQDGSLWVSEYAYAQVVHLDPDGRELGRVGAPRFAKAPGPFRSPTFLAARPGGGVFVVDSLLAEVFEVDGTGQVVRRWRQSKGDEGLLNLPKGLVVMGDGGVLVADGLRSSLQSFSKEGRLETVYYAKNKRSLDLAGLVSAAVDPKSGEIYALSKLDGAVYRLSMVE